MYAATQWQDNVQKMVSQALSKPHHLINIHTRRVGGAYGGKARIAGHVAGAAAVAANKIKRPVRLVMDIESNMAVLGKRHAHLIQYKAAVDENHRLIYVTMSIYADSGFSFFDDVSFLAQIWAQVNKFDFHYFLKTVFNVQFSFNSLYTIQLHGTLKQLQWPLTLLQLQS